ncbi:hypothetical protein FSP39_002554 [Pinctada imbricata]|uniref:Uncharacterized protein n=1 Tax=Pinctada imbricata TaxID=66713 RepID=A0AA89C317_PINIB|nr:hypothetical protein FSP39_002554 [Pinctada imbricata]
MWSYHPYVDHSYTRPYEFAKNDDTHGVARNSENFEAENDTENVIGAWTNDIEQECQATVKIQNDDDDERLEVDTTIEICINEFDFDNKDWFRNMHDAENNEADRRLECVENSCGGIILKDENIMYDEANVAENNIISGDEANNAESSVINSDEANNAENNITNSDEANDAEHNIISGDEASDAENNIMNGDEANDVENNIISGDEASDAENNINNGDEASDVENNIIKGDDINCIGNMCEADLVENENVANGHSYDSAINTTTAQLRIGKMYGDIHVRNENVMYSNAHVSEDNDNDSCIGETRTHKDKHVKKKTMVCQYLTYCYKTKMNAENSKKKRHKYYIEYTYEDEHVTEKNNINCDGEGMEMGTSIQENAMFVDTSSVENSRSVDASSSVENSMSVDTNENAVENMEWSIEEHDHDHEENDESDNGESDKSDNSVGETCEDYHIVKEENVMMYEDCHGRDTEIYTSFLGYENVDENKDLFNYSKETENGDKGSRVVDTGPPTIPLSKPVVTEIGEETVRLAWKPSIFQRTKSSP